MAEEKKIGRREFLKVSAAAAAFTIVPRHVLGGAGFIAPSEKINIASIGVGWQGTYNMEQFLRSPEVRIVAVCDVNTESNNYWRTYRNGVGGREPAKRIVEEYYAADKAAGTYKGCGVYVDYHQMLEERDEIDAVVVCTPDHNHAPATMAAIKKGKHVYCEKPLTHTVEEARLIAEAASKAGVATQMGNQAQAEEGTRLVAEWIADGAIGDVREVHIWSGKLLWPQAIDRPTDTPPVPDGLDWDKWLGPAPERPYHPCYLPVVWRGWWDFGGGLLADMGCHMFEASFRALKLGAPETVEATSTKMYPETAPIGAMVYYKFPARGDKPPVVLTWYEGGLMPRRPEELEEGRKMLYQGTLFVGDKGKLICDWGGQSPRLLPETKMQAYKRPEKSIPRSPGHHQEWLDACKGKGKAGSNFDVAGPMAEAVLLGNVAMRTGKKIRWDAANLKATNVPDATEYISKKYRSGYEL